MTWFYKFMSWFRGKNLENTPISLILDQMHEPRSLPMGKQEFEDWSDRIISGALIPADIDSQKFALAHLITAMGPTEDHKEDIFFIKSLRRSAIQQCAQSIQQHLKEKSMAKLAAEKPPEPKDGLSLVKPETPTPVMHRP